MLLFHAVLRKLDTLVVIATSQTFQFSWFLQQPSSTGSGVAYSNRVAAKISAGGVGSPYNQLYLWVTLPLVLTTVVKIPSVE